MKATTIAAAAKAVAFAVFATTVAFGVAAPANAASELMYGDPVAAAEYWHEQRYDDCVLMSSADIIGQLAGEAPSEQAIIAKAHATPSVVHAGPIYTKPTDPENPNSGDGASLADVPTLLAQYHVIAVVIDRDDTARSGIRPGIAGLKQALGGGHKVIVSLNGELIWHQPVEAKDKFGNPESDHAVVVTGVDATHGIVHLNDSGTSDGRDERIPLQLFVQSWETSNELMIVTL